MKDIEVWRVTSSDGAVSASRCESMNRTETEKKLEDLLVEVPKMLGDIVLVGRQTATDGGPLDLLGVDAEGRLVVFELKRGTLTRDAVAQVIDYVSYLAEMDAESLARHIEARSGTGGIEKIENFAQWHTEQFGGEGSFTETPRAVLVGLGVDDATRRMVDFMASSGMDIALLTFHAFETDDGFLLARQVEVHQVAKPASTARRYTKSENQGLLDALALRLGVKPLLEAMKSDTRGKLVDPHIWPHGTCYALSFIETSDSGNPTYRKYIGLHLDERKEGLVQLVLESRSVTEKTRTLIESALSSTNGSPKAVDAGDRVSVWFDGETWAEQKALWQAVFEEVRQSYERRKAAEDIQNGDDDSTPPSVAPEPGASGEASPSPEPPPAPSESGITHEAG